MGEGDFDPTLGGVVAVYYSPYCWYGTTWLLKEGNWTNVTALVGSTPPAGEWRTMAFDDADNYSLLLDGENVSASGPEEYNGTWALLDSLAADLVATPTVLEVGQNLTLDMGVDGGLRPYTIGVSGVPPGCSSPTNGVLEVCGPTAAGNYTIWVNVTDPAANESVTVASALTVFPKLAATARAATPATTEGYPANFTASVSGGRGPYDAVWSFGDGSSASRLDASHDYGATGTYLANFTVSDSLGVTVRVTDVSVVVNAPLLLTATSNRTVTDAGAPVSFTANPLDGTPPRAVSWAFQDGTPNASGASVNHTFVVTGMYRVVVTATDSAGATQHDAINVTVNAAPAATLAVNDSNHLHRHRDGRNGPVRLQLDVR
jgi:PKD repeat protein